MLQTMELLWYFWSMTSYAVGSPFVLSSGGYGKLSIALDW